MTEVSPIKTLNPLLSLQTSAVSRPRRHSLVPRKKDKDEYPPRTSLKGTHGHLLQCMNTGERIEKHSRNTGFKIEVDIGT